MTDLNTAQLVERFHLEPATAGTSVLSRLERRVPIRRFGTRPNIADPAAFGAGRGSPAVKSAPGRYLKPARSVNPICGLLAGMVVSLEKLSPPAVSVRAPRHR